MTTFALPELHREIRGIARRFAGSVLLPLAESIDGGDPIPATVLAQLAELGFWGVATDEARGGVGLDALAYALVVEALASGSPSVARRVAVHAGPGLAGLAQTEIDLQPFCTGERFVTFVPATGLTPAPADHYVAALGHGTDARVERVDPTGHRGAALARVTLDELDSFGDVDAPLQSWHDLGLGALALGSGRAAIDAAIEYGQERKQFGRELTRFQAIQWKIADSVTALDAAELLVHRAALSLDPVHSATARAMAARAALLASDHALQIHGGYGYTREYPVERHLRSARMVVSTDAARRALSF